MVRMSKKLGARAGTEGAHRYIRRRGLRVAQELRKEVRILDALPCAGVQVGEHRMCLHVHQLYPSLSLKTTHRIAQERHAPARVRRQVRVHRADIPLIWPLDAPENGADVAAVVGERGEQLFC